MTRCRRFRPGLAALGLALLPGCWQTAPPLAPPPAAVLPQVPATAAALAEPTPTLKAAQVADVQVALGKSLEERGAPEQALAAYQAALRHDPSRADAAARLAVLYDLQGRFAESEELHRKAVAAQPSNADLHCNLGYSLYLRHDWAGAEASLRQALTLAPGHRRAHNNLGLVLAHAGRADEALVEFRRAGCSEAEARANLGFALTLEQRWDEARGQYERALAEDPSSAAARKGLRELDALAARVARPPRAAAAGENLPPAPAAN
ncbi:MAG TPA: tetratricopeptide repeat protein [Gemmataceae bacterium]|nr:tetratricopeptide repeat protein [Gemmataceae bacterium]